MSWILVMASALTTCVTLGKLVFNLEAFFSSLVKRQIVIPTHGITRESQQGHGCDSPWHEQIT